MQRAMLGIMWVDTCNLVRECIDFFIAADFQNCRITNFSYFKLLNLWKFVTAAIEMNTDSRTTNPTTTICLLILFLCLRLGI